MKYGYNKSFAFTIAEILIVLSILSVLTMTSFGIVKVKKYYTNKFMYYAAFTTLKQSIGNIIADGCTDNDVSSSYCASNKSLPYRGYNAAATLRGFCTRLVEYISTIGTVSCSATAVGGSTSTAFLPANDSTYRNFTTSNGQRFFNFNNTISAGSYYTIYVDIDGTKKVSGVLNTDVFAFHVYLDGSIYPVYSSSLAVGPNSTNFLSASVRYVNSSGVEQWAGQGITYYAAVCGATGNYDGTACTQLSACTTNDCEVIINKPIF